MIGSANPTETTSRRRRAKSQEKPATCYHCAHLRYNGPQEVRNLANHKTAIRLNPGDAEHGPGRYSCAKFGEVICRADTAPAPLEEDGSCKEPR